MLRDESLLGNCLMAQQTVVLKGRTEPLQTRHRQVFQLLFHHRLHLDVMGIRSQCWVYGMDSPAGGCCLSERGLTTGIR